MVKDCQASINYCEEKKKNKTGTGERGEGYPQDMMVFSKLCFNDYQFSFMDTKHWFPFSF
jgi:hypothetical protein